MKIKNFLLIGATVLVFVFLVVLLAQMRSNTTKEIGKIQKSTVAIVSGIDLKKEILTSNVIVGSGFCYKKGTFITNYHNVKDSDGVIYIVTHDDLVVPASMIAKDEQNDIALLEADVDVTPISFGKYGSCAVGQSVMSISTPISVYLRGTFSKGIITNLDVKGFGMQRLLQTDINLSPGCSGAPIINSRGKVVGMVTFKSTEFGAEGLGFAIPSDRLLEIIDRLENGIETPNLEIIFQTDIYQKYGIPGAAGMVIQALGDTSPVIGLLHPGDLVIKVNNQPVKNLVEYMEVIEKSHENQDIVFLIIRGGEELMVTVKGDLLW